MVKWASYFGPGTKRQKKYAKRDEAILYETEIVKRQTEALQKENDSLKQDINGYRTIIAALEGHGDRLQAQKKVMEKRHEDAKTLLAQVKNDLNEANRQYNIQLKKPNTDVAELNGWKTKVAELEKEKKALDSNVQTLNSMIQSL